MTKKVIIKSYGEERKGTNERGNWQAREVEVVWQEEGANGFFEQVQMVTVQVALDTAKLDEAISQGTEVNCRMYFNVREYTDKSGNVKKINNVRGYLPSEFELKPL